MQQDKYKTLVIFLVNANDVYALFPTQLYNGWDKKLYDSYAHIGQHGSCHIDYVNKSRLATEAEYLNLQSELNDVVGYNLETVNPHIGNSISNDTYQHMVRNNDFSLLNELIKQDKTTA